MMTAPVYFYPTPEACDICRKPFCEQIGVVMYDAKTKQGPWGCLDEPCFHTHGAGRLGTGYGQKYVRQTDGRFLKVDG
jgi:hypothetical protein